MMISIIQKRNMSTRPERPEGPRARDPLAELNMAKFYDKDVIKHEKELARVSDIVEDYLRDKMKFYAILFDEPGKIGYPLEPIFLILGCEAIVDTQPEMIPNLLDLDDVGLIYEKDGKLVQNRNYGRNYAIATSLEEIKKNLAKLKRDTDAKNESQSGWNWKTYVVVGTIIGLVLLVIKYIF